jgi:hypothetical protein
MYWLKNRFNPLEGYSEIPKGFRILYELQDEGPAFIMESKDKAWVWPSIEEARRWISENNRNGCIIVIIGLMINIFLNRKICQMKMIIR